MSDFTRLEKAVIKAICLQHPECADVLRSQVATARVTNRKNTGCGMFVDFVVGENCARLSPIGFPYFGDATSTIGGLEIHFMVGVSREGLAEQIEGWSVLDGDISDLDLSTAPFTPLVV